MAQSPEPPASQASDPAIVSDDVLAAWMVAYGPGLKRFFSKKTTPADAEDLVQEVFLNLRTRAVAAQVENVERYLFRIAHNVLASRYRLSSTRGRAAEVPLDAADDLADELSPERVLLGKLEYARAISAVRKLPPRARAAFMFHRFDEMTYPAIAKRMGISLNAVRHLMTRALAQILQELERKP